MEKPKIKVLIAEDSIVIQKVLRNMVENDDRFELIGIAFDGRQAVELALKHKPDVISMDVNMPIVDGVEATRQIMDVQPTPIVIVSSYYNSSEIDMAIKVLDAGAVNIMEKPNGPGHPKYEYSRKNYLNILKLMAEIKVVGRRQKIKVTEKETSYKPILTVPKKVSTDYEILVVGASAGGPESARHLFEKLPANFPLPVVFVQHIDPHFADGFAVWLNTYSNMPVVIAYDNQEFLPGKIYMSPGGKHIFLRSKTTLGLLSETNSNLSVPSVNKLFESAENIFGKKTIAVILSGMGCDGAEQMKKLKNAGAYTYAQDEKTCLVYGMPKEAVTEGAVIKVLPPTDISTDICQLIKINN